MLPQAVDKLLLTAMCCRQSSTYKNTSEKRAATCRQAKTTNNMLPQAVGKLLLTTICCRQSSAYKNTSEKVCRYLSAGKNYK